MKTVRRISAREVYAIGQLLHEHWDKEKCAFKPEWSDERIATTVGGAANTVAAQSVAHVRKQLGMLLQTTARVTIAVERVEQLENEQKRLIELVGNQVRTEALLRKRVARLEYIVDRIGNNIGLKALTYVSVKAEAERKFGPEIDNG